MPKITTQLYGELALLPYRPKSPLRESFEFLTDVVESKNSTERRHQLRTKARQAFSVSYVSRLNKIPEEFNVEYGSLRKDQAIPVWSEPQYVGTILAGATSINCETAYFDLRENSLALLYNNCGNFQVIEIDEVFSDHITLLYAATAFSHALLFPVRKGWISGSIEKKINGSETESTLTFRVDDTAEITASVPTQYLGSDIYFDLPLLSGNSLAASLSQQQDVVDYELGKVFNRSAWNRPRYGKPWNFVLETAAERWNHKKFLYRRMGRLNQFWFPTFENNLRILNTGNITTALNISSDSFIDYASLRTHIAVEAGGVWYARAVSNPLQTSPSVVQLTLSSALNVQASTITRASYLGLHRFDADRIELNHGNRITESNIPILELEP